jgi:hypothetical protein
MKMGFIIMSKIMSKLLSPASAAALTLAFLMPAQAGEIDVAGTTTQALTFTAAGGNTLEVSSVLGFGGTAGYSSGNASSDSSGSAAFGPVHFFTGPEVAGIFTPIPPASQTFSYQSNTMPPADAVPPGTPDFLTADIEWTELDANAPLGEPQLIGTGVINTSDGDPTFLADFPVGGGINIIANFPLNGPCDLTQLAAGPCDVTFEVASFEGDVVTPGLPPPPPPLIETPEPMSSFTVLGLALCGLWGAYLMMRRQSGVRFVPEPSV